MLEDNRKKISILLTCVFLFILSFNTLTKAEQVQPIIIDAKVIIWGRTEYVSYIGENNEFFCSVSGGNGILWCDFKEEHLVNDQWITTWQGERDSIDRIGYHAWGLYGYESASKVRFYLRVYDDYSNEAEWMSPEVTIGKIIYDSDTTEVTLRRRQTIVIRHSPNEYNNIARTMDENIAEVTTNHIIDKEELGGTDATGIIIYGRQAGTTETVIYDENYNVKKRILIHVVEDPNTEPEPAEKYSSTDNGITAVFTIPRENAAIGRRHHIKYELSGGSNEFSEISLMAIYKRGWGAGSGSSKKLNEWMGDVFLEPTAGKEMNLVIYGTDTEGRSFYIELEKTITIDPNPNIDVLVSFDSVTGENGNSVQANYLITGCESFTGRAYWAVGDNGDYSSNVQPTDLKSLAGTAILNPEFGDTAFFIIQGSDENGKPVYIEEGPIALEGSETEEITVTFSNYNETAYIGQPYSIHYEIKGGSGIYPDIQIMKLYEYSWGGGYGNSSVLESDCGDIIIEPEDGVLLSLAIHGMDSYGKSFYVYLEDSIPIRPNPALPVTISLP